MYNVVVAADSCITMCLQDKSIQIKTDLQAIIVYVIWDYKRIERNNNNSNYENK